MSHVAYSKRGGKKGTGVDDDVKGTVVLSGIMGHWSERLGKVGRAVGFGSFMISKEAKESWG